MNLFAPLCLALAVLALAGQAAAQPDENEAFVITAPERTMEQVDQAYAEVPPVRYTSPRDRWRYLPRAARSLRSRKGELRVVMLGDSIINDLSRSRWDGVLQRNCPNCAITKVTCVRGSTGCWWYREAGRVQRYVLDYRPDLLIIGGISQRDDIDSIRDVIQQVRAGSKCDILLLTGPFGATDPNDSAWQPQVDPKGEDYRARLMRLAREMKTGYMDLCGVWGEYVRQSGREVAWFKRDVVHANERGEQVIGRILAAHLTPEGK